MKKFKVIIILSCTVISMLGITNLANNNSLFSTLSQLELINAAQAEDLGEITVYPREPLTAEVCRYTERSVTYGGSVSGTIGASVGVNTSVSGSASGGANASVTFTEKTGTKNFCMADSQTKCYPIPECHP